MLAAGLRYEISGLIELGKTMILMNLTHDNVCAWLLHATRLGPQLADLQRECVRRFCNGRALKSATEHTYGGSKRTVERGQFEGPENSKSSPPPSNFRRFDALSRFPIEAYQTYHLSQNDWISDLVFQLRPIPSDSLTPEPPPGEPISSRFSVVFETFSGHFRVVFESPGGGSVLGVDESGRMGCSWKTRSLD